LIMKLALTILGFCVRLISPQSLGINVPGVFQVLPRRIEMNAKLWVLVLAAMLAVITGCATAGEDLPSSGNTTIVGDTDAEETSVQTDGDDESAENGEEIEAAERPVWEYLLPAKADDVASTSTDCNVEWALEENGFFDRKYQKIETVCWWQASRDSARDVYYDVKRSSGEIETRMVRVMIAARWECEYLPNTGEEPRNYFAEGNFITCDAVGGPDSDIRYIAPPSWANGAKLYGLERPDDLSVPMSAEQLRCYSGQSNIPDGECTGVFPSEEAAVWYVTNIIFLLR